MTTPADHAATVREGLYDADGVSHAALDALQAQAEANPFRSGEEKKLRKAAEDERDRLAARVTELETALREIAEAHRLADALVIARAALATGKGGAPVGGVLAAGWDDAT